MGGIWATLVFPILFIFFRGAQDEGCKERATQPDAPGALIGISLSEGLRSPTLYKLLMAAGLFAFTAIGVVVHFVPILTDSHTATLTWNSSQRPFGAASTVRPATRSRSQST